MMMTLTTARDAAALADAAYENARSAENEAEGVYRTQCHRVTAVEIGQSRANLAEGRAEVTRLLALYAEAMALTKSCLQRRDVARERLQGLEDEQSGQGRHKARLRVETALTRMKVSAGGAHRARQDVRDSEYAMERGAVETLAALDALAKVDDRYGALIGHVKAALGSGPAAPGGEDRRIRVILSLPDRIRPV